MFEVEERQATLQELLETDGKAELIGGKIVHMMPTGDLPGEIALNIAFLLKDEVKRSGIGHVRGDFVGYAVPMLSSGRQSFAPDASYYLGPLPQNRMKFVQGPPLFAVEVRSENDYGPLAENEMRGKRSDYFEAGTLVVWDVDPLAKCINRYQASNPDFPKVFRLADLADAEPAIKGWRVPVLAVFESL